MQESGCVSRSHFLLQYLMALELSTPQEPDPERPADGDSGYGEPVPEWEA